jgi:adenosylcobalamin-dependent ribonucleoside-triphosphate reductase
VTDALQLPASYADQYRTAEIPWGYSGLGEMVYARTYARISEDGRRESWPDTVLRVVNGAQAIGSQLTSEEMERLFDYMISLKGTVSGRGLWQFGTPLVEQMGGGSLLNCSVVPVSDFPALMDMLMLGTGVGYSVERQYVYEMPRLKELDRPIEHQATVDADFIVPDKREGWSELLARVLHSYTVSGQGFTWSTTVLRSAGAPLKSFGGTSSGPLVLIDGINDIIRVLESRTGKKLRSIDALDIANIIGRVVVAGNARRSAQLALGDPDDHLYAKAKNWASGNIPAWRSNANISIAADSYDEIPGWYWKSGWDGSGEIHGLLNVGLARTQGRIGEKVADRKVVTTNPCGEVFLEPYETCNLATLYLPNISTYEEFTDLSVILYKIQKATALYRHQNPKTQAVQRRNLRLGQSVTGIAQATDDQLNWLDEAYAELRRFDDKWSEELGVSPSIKLTAIQPSGTLSLLPGVTPGVHAAQARHYIRRVRFGADDALVDVARQRGYTVVPDRNLDGTDNHSQLVVEFPASAPDGAITMEEMTAVRQLELVARMQAEWADNSVSVTVNYRDEEIPDIKDWLAENYRTRLKSVSFLRHFDHNFPLPPYETIDAAQYEAMLSRIDLSVALNPDDQSQDLVFDDCEGGACPVR